MSTTTRSRKLELIRQKAVALYGGKHEVWRIVIPQKAGIQPTSRGGCWVEAWVWVPEEKPNA